MTTWKAEIQGKAEATLPTAGKTRQRTLKLNHISELLRATITRFEKRPDFLFWIPSLYILHGINMIGSVHRPILVWYNLRWQLVFCPAIRRKSKILRNIQRRNVLVSCMFVAILYELTLNVQSREHGKYLQRLYTKNVRLPSFYWST